MKFTLSPEGQNKVNELLAATPRKNFTAAEIASLLEKASGGRK